MFFVFRAAQPWLCLPGHGGERLSVCLVFPTTHPSSTRAHKCNASFHITWQTSAVIFLHYSIFTPIYCTYCRAIIYSPMILCWSRVTCDWSRGTTCWLGSRRTLRTATRATWAAWRVRWRGMDTAATTRRTSLCCLTRDGAQEEYNLYLQLLVMIVTIVIAFLVFYTGCDEDEILCNYSWKLSTLFHRVS